MSADAALWWDRIARRFAAAAYAVACTAAAIVNRLKGDQHL